MNDRYRKEILGDILGPLCDAFGIERLGEIRRVIFDFDSTGFPEVIVYKLANPHKAIGMDPEVVKKKYKLVPLESEPHAWVSRREANET